MPVKIILLAHNLRSAHNVGSLLRTCDGIGVEKLVLSGYTPYPAMKDDTRLPHIARKLNAQIDKTALGAQDSQAWEYTTDIEQTIHMLKNQGYKVCALEQSLGSIRLDKFTPPEKVALILGNEVDGIEQEILEKVDDILEIPMAGSKESFNVVQAAAMALYRFRYMR